MKNEITEALGLETNWIKTLEQVSTQDLIFVLSQRSDVIFVGETFFKGQVMELCSATESEAEQFMEECLPSDNDGVCNEASDNLVQLFENWKEINNLNNLFKNK